ncbi:MAG TPA: prolyl oligopeptidase family serine peptidase [Actinomycetota bacterium]
MRRTSLLVIVAIMLPLAALPVRAAGSLPSVAMGPRPGPDALYRPAATTPILTNAGEWAATPLMVSGAAAYDGGEYLYQDYVYDAYGANTSDAPFAQPETVPNAADLAFGGMTGDLAYPTDVATYGHNAADILEFRARLDDTGRVVYRVTLNTVLDAAAAAVAIGVDTGAGGSDDWGYGIGSLGSLGLDHVVVATGFDPATNQAEVATGLQPGGATWRHYLIAGLWDANANAFKPIQEQPSATMPGGAHGTAPPPVFNVGFRFDEPMGPGSLGGILADDPNNSVGARTVGYGHWREHAQAKALAARDISGMHADVDFGAIAAETDDFSGVPTRGYLSRLYVSHLDLGEGARVERPMLRGPIQPYSLYVPPSYDGSAAAPLTLALHSLSAGYNQYRVFAPNLHRDLGDERDALILTPAGRGPDGWYHDEAEIDTFEAWADAAARYTLDANQVSVYGYSMGGYGTYKYAAQYPDLFTAGFAVVGPADENILGGPTAGSIEDAHNTYRIFENLRHVPIMGWFGTNDELVPVAGSLNVAARWQQLGYEHEADFFPGFDHFALSIVDEWKRGAAWLGRAPVDRNPSRVTFKYLPEMDNAALGLVHDHAYWVEDVRVAGGARAGLVDAAVMNGGCTPRYRVAIPPAGTDPAPHVKSGLRYYGGTCTPPRNSIELTLDGVAAATLWPQRGGASLGTLTIEAASTADATLTLKGTFGTRTVAIPAGGGTFTVVL